MTQNRPMLEDTPQTPDTQNSPPAFFTIEGHAHTPLLFVCDHAANHVPTWINGGDLGIAPDDMQRHIAFDIGVAGVTQMLAARFQAHAALSNFSRLVIDPNRGEDDPTLIMELYDQTLIPSNRDLSPDARQERLNKLHRPYHKAIDDKIAAITASGQAPVIVSIHSFTPRLRGQTMRPWHIGVLSNSDRRLSGPLLERLHREDDIVTGDNEPYTGALANDTLHRHAYNPGHLHTLVEFRNDLIADHDGQAIWAQRFGDALADTFTRLEISYA